MMQVTKREKNLMLSAIVLLVVYLFFYLWVLLREELDSMGEYVPALKEEVDTVESIKKKLTTKPASNELPMVCRDVGLMVHEGKYMFNGVSFSQLDLCIKRLTTDFPGKYTELHIEKSVDSNVKGYLK